MPPRTKHPARKKSNAKKPARRKPAARKPTTRKKPAQKKPEFNLHLTSPHTSDQRSGGNQVHHAQQALHANKFSEFYKANNNDGIYGPETAAATKHAKYALGFPDKAVDQIYDDALDVRLTGARPLGSAYEKRRKDRKKASPKSGSKVKAVQLALKEVGYHEGPNNANKFGREYGLDNQPWCAIFVSIMEKHAGNKWFRYSYCPNIYADALHGNNGMSFTTHPEEGDVALFHFSGGEYPCSHVGLVISANPWRWISGNFGDGVTVSTADRSSVVKFVRMPG
jgi:hypothetical protein